MSELVMGILPSWGGTLRLVRALFTIDSYSGPWTIAGQNAAYFVGWCPACGFYGTVSLTVTLDGGRHFHRYRVPKLSGFRGTGIRVVGDDVTITARSQSPSFTGTPGPRSGERTPVSHGATSRMRLMRYAPCSSE